MSERLNTRAEAENGKGTRDPHPKAQGTHGRLPQDRWCSGQEALNRPFSGSFDQVTEHHVPVLAAVVAPRPLVQVALKPLMRDGVMRSAHTRLEQTEEPVDGLRMHIPVHVDAG